uniref:Protein SCAF11 isoform X2 n=1 Tax=Geotrypetes seraphini TaxID=260995 RepID=A0A6P8S916_GEOSA|nr:protein SCAF11 isoform X2 [Geotrypetes seraphini]
MATEKVLWMKSPPCVRIYTCYPWRTPATSEKTQEHARTSSTLYSEADRCLICFDCLLEQEVGFLENCCHVFCLSCILKWAKTVASCPIDRKPFQAVYKFGVSQEFVKIQIKRSTIGKENCSCNKSIKQTSCIHAENKSCTRSSACKGSLYTAFCKTFKIQHRNELNIQNDKKESTSVKINEPRRLASSHQHFRNDFYCFSPLSHLSGNSSCSFRSLSLDAAEISDISAIIRQKRQELDSLWSYTMPMRTERISSLCSGFQTEILSVTLSLIRGNMCLVNPVSPENLGRACVLTHTQDGVEKKQASGSSGNKGSRKKPANTTERRRSTRNSKTKETSQLPSPPKSSNSGSDTPNGNNSSVNIETPTGSKKQHPKQRGKRAAKKTPPAKKRSSSYLEELSSSDTQSGDTVEPETVPKFLLQEKKNQSDGELSPAHSVIALATAPEQNFGIEMSTEPTCLQLNAHLSLVPDIEQQSDADLSSVPDLQLQPDPEFPLTLIEKQYLDAEHSPAPVLERQIDTELLPAPDLEQQMDDEFYPAPDLERQTDLAPSLERETDIDLSPAPPLEREIDVEISVAPTLKRQPGAKLSPVLPLKWHPDSKLSPALPLERQPDAELSPAPSLERQLDAELSLAPPLERQPDAELSSAPSLERQPDAELSPAPSLERQPDAELSPAPPLERQLDNELSPAPPLEKQPDAELSPASPLKQQPDAELSPAPPLERQMDVQLSPAPPLEQQMDVQLSPAPPLERQPDINCVITKETAVDFSKCDLGRHEEFTENCSTVHCSLKDSDICSREPPVLSREEYVQKIESRSINENVIDFERVLAQSSTVAENRMPLHTAVSKLFEHPEFETSESISKDVPECIVEESEHINSEKLSHSVGEESLFLTEKLKSREPCEINTEQLKESESSTKTVSILHDSLCSDPNESENDMKISIKQEKTKDQISSLCSSDKKDETRVQDTETSPASIMEKKGVKKETRTRKSRFHSPSTTWSPDKDNRRENKRSRSRSRPRDFSPKQKSRSQSKDKDNKEEQWRDRNRDRRNRRHSRSRSRSRSQSRSRTRWRDSTFERNERDDRPLIYRGWWKNDSWRSSRGNFRGNDRYTRNDQERQNENFRKERYDFNRDVAEHYLAEKSKNDYPDWIMERIESETDSRNVETFKGSHWEGNRYNSRDSWTQNISSGSNWNRGRGGNRGHSKFRGGFGYRNQNENRWQSRQPLSGNLNSSGNESSRFPEHQNFRRRNEHDYFDAPSDRSGWTSASSWAVRKTLPADVQNYYSKRGKNSSSPQAGWSRPEDEISEQAQHLVGVSLQQPLESHPVIPQDPQGVLESKPPFPDPTINDQANQQDDGSQIPVNMMQPQLNVMPPQMNAQHQPMNIFPYPVGVPPPPPPPLMNIQHTPFNLHPQLPMHLHPAVPLMQVSAPTSAPQGLPPPPPPPPPSQQVSYITSQPEGKQLQGTSSAPPVSNSMNTPLLSASVSVVENEGTVQGPSSGNTSSSSYNKTTNAAIKPAVRKEPVTMEISTDNFKKDKKLQIQEKAAEEVKLAIKPFYQNKDITKEEYKEIVRKAVDKVCHSKSGEVDSAKVANLVKAYVDKYKHSRKGILKKNAE